jgi:hypothetical protein
MKQLLGGLTSSIGPGINNAIQAGLMAKAMQPQGGVKDRLTGLTFGGTTPEQNPAYIMMVQQMKQQQADRENRQKQAALMEEMAIKHEYEMMGKEFDANIDFEANTVKNMQTAINGLIKDGIINRDLINPETFAAAYMGGDTAALQEILALSPDYDVKVKEDAAILWQAIMEAPEEEQAKMLSDPRNQTVLGLAGYMPDANARFNANERVKLARENNAARQELAYYNQGQQNARHAGSMGSAAASRAQRAEEFAYRKKRDAEGGTSKKAASAKKIKPDTAKTRKTLDGTEIQYVEDGEGNVKEAWASVPGATKYDPPTVVQIDPAKAKTMIQYTPGVDADNAVAPVATGGGQTTAVNGFQLEAPE